MIAICVKGALHDANSGCSKVAMELNAGMYALRLKTI